MDIFQAARDGNIPRIETLLKQGVDVNSKIGLNKLTPLWKAVRYSNKTSSLETVKFLLDKGADPFILFNNPHPQATIFDICTTNECRKLVSEYMWKYLSTSDHRLMTSLQMQRKDMNKELWEIIIFRKRQQQLCKNLNDEKNKYILLFFAIELGIPVTEEMTKTQLCSIISNQLASGRKYL